MRRLRRRNRDVYITQETTVHHVNLFWSCKIAIVERLWSQTMATFSSVRCRNLILRKANVHHDYSRKVYREFYNNRKEIFLKIWCCCFSVVYSWALKIRRIFQLFLEKTFGKVQNYKVQPNKEIFDIEERRLPFQNSCVLISFVDLQSNFSMIKCSYYNKVYNHYFYISNEIFSASVVLRSTVLCCDYFQDNTV